MKRAWCTFAFCMLVTARAFADDNHVGAEALFDEGLRLFDQGKVADACPKFAASYKLDPASGTLLNLGRCYEKMNKTASAWIAYRDLVSLAHKENNPKREAQAKQLADKLAPKLAKLTIDAPEGVSIKLDENTLDPAELKTPIPIDPGDHAIVASASNKQSWTKSLKIVPAEQAMVAVPPLQDEASANQPPPPAPSPSPANDDGMGGMRIAALASGGLGVAGLAVGGIFGGIALSHASDARDHCVSRCDGDGLDARKDARSSADISTVGLIAGGVLLAGGVVLWLVAPQRRVSTGKAERRAGGGAARNGRSTYLTEGISLQF